MYNIDLERFLFEKKIKQKEISAITGLHQSFVSDIKNKKKPMPKAKYLLLKDHYHDIDKYVMEPASVYVRHHKITHVPLIAETQFFEDGVITPGPDNDLHEHTNPIMNSEGFSFIVRDNSNYPTLDAGEMVITDRINVTSSDQIKNNYLYVIRTKGRTIIKRVYKHLDNDTIWLSVDNRELEIKSQEIKWNEIDKMYKCKILATYRMAARLEQSDDDYTNIESIPEG